MILCTRKEKRILLILYWNISIIVIHNGYLKIIDLFKCLQMKEVNHVNHYHGSTCRVEQPLAGYADQILILSYLVDKEVLCGKIMIS